MNSGSMSYVTGVNSISPELGKKRPGKMIIIKKNDIMQPFQEISPIVTHKE
jgi:hypothetical protein